MNASRNIHAAGQNDLPPIFRNDAKVVNLEILESTRPFVMSVCMISLRLIHESDCTLDGLSGYVSAISAPKADLSEDLNSASPGLTYTRL